MTKNIRESGVFNLGSLRGAELGAELITNGAFTSDLSGWTAGSDWSWNASSAAASDGGTASGNSLTQTITTVAGQAYQVSATVSAVSDGNPSLTINGTIVAQWYSTDPAVSTKTATYTPTTGTSTTLSFTGGNAIWTVDDVSVRAVRNNYDSSTIKRPTRRWGGITGRSLVTSGGSLPTTGVLSLAEMNVTTSFSGGTTTAAPGGVLFEDTGTHSWTVPANVYSVSVVCVGPGGGRYSSANTSAGGGGGGLGYANNVSVTPGQTITVQVGAAPAVGAGTRGTDSYFKDTSTCVGKSGQNADSTSDEGVGGQYVGTGGGFGGDGGSGKYSGGGGAGGYSGDGGAGRGATVSTSTRTGFAGAGGGGGGGAGYYAGSGGGVDVYGEGSSGAGGTGSSNANGEGHGGSGGEDGASHANITANASKYGGAAGYRVSGLYPSQGAGVGADGAVRVIWGTGRSFPSTSVDAASSTAGEDTTTYT